MTDDKKIWQYKQDMSQAMQKAYFQILPIIDNISFPCFPLIEDEEKRLRMYDFLADRCAFIEEIKIGLRAYGFQSTTEKSKGKIATTEKKAT